MSGYQFFCYNFYKRSNYLPKHSVLKTLNKSFFSSNPYKIDVMITSLIEILELLNFGYITAITV